MRIAWIGPMPVPSGGVPGVAWLIVKELSEQGHHIDCYVAERMRTFLKDSFISAVFAW
jgi:hypothetical protein